MGHFAGLGRIGWGDQRLICDGPAIVTGLSEGTFRCVPGDAWGHDTCSYGPSIVLIDRPAISQRTAIIPQALP
jgi:hypothetical protein